VSKIKHLGGFHDGQMTGNGHKNNKLINLDHIEHNWNLYNLKYVKIHFRCYIFHVLNLSILQEMWDSNSYFSGSHIIRKEIENLQH
jgi:hypothetical protein